MLEKPASMRVELVAEEGGKRRNNRRISPRILRPSTSPCRTLPVLSAGILRSVISSSLPFDSSASFSSSSSSSYSHCFFFLNRSQAEAPPLPPSQDLPTSPIPPRPSSPAPLSPISPSLRTPLFLSMEEGPPMSPSIPIMSQSAPSVPIGGTLSFLSVPFSSHPLHRRSSVLTSTI